jgi:hypothetical protein
MSFYGNRVKIEAPHESRTMALLRGMQASKQQAEPPAGSSSPAHAARVDNIANDDSESDSDDALTLQSIIADRPRTKVVREFFKANLAAIKSPEEELFAH